VVGASGSPRVSQAQLQSWQLYANGRGVPRTMRRHGDGTRKPLPRAMRGRRAQLGQLYAVGRGVPQTMRRQRGWYRKPLPSGNAWAQLSWRCVVNGRAGHRTMCGTAVVEKGRYRGTRHRRSTSVWLYERVNMFRRTMWRAGMWSTWLEQMK